MQMDKKFLASLSVFSALVALVLLVLSRASKSSGEQTPLSGSFSLLFFFVAVLLLNLASMTAKEGYGSCGCSAGAKPAASHKRPLCLTVSADSWCGYSKKMSAEKDKIKKALDKAGIDYVLVSDTADKEQFDKISKAHKVDGFPHSILIVDGKKVHDVPGYMQHDAFANEIVAKASA